MRISMSPIEHQDQEKDRKVWICLKVLKIKETTQLPGHSR